MWKDGFDRDELKANAWQWEREYASRAVGRVVCPIRCALRVGTDSISFNSTFPILPRAKLSFPMAALTRASFDLTSRRNSISPKVMGSSLISMALH